MNVFVFDFIKDDDISDWAIVRADDYLEALDIFNKLFGYKEIVHVFVRLW